ncbi:MAG: hypothetical protein KKA07_01545 [Bacteroidetes bacterium]|nr:hypothetical protein [Bacteroidota bacterium]MBU1717733.1 hypothetical protein [Bacteroidota bacterium]
MKTIVAFSLFLLACYTMSAQKIDEQIIEFDYVRLPLQLLPEGISGYSSQVILEYEEGILELQKLQTGDFQAALKDYEEKLVIAQSKYDSLMAIYKVEKEKAIARYDSAMVAYRKRPGVERFFENKILRDSERPYLILPSYPSVRFPYRPYESKEEYQKIFNKEMLADTYLKIDGIKKASTNAVKIVVTLLGYDFLDPVLRNESSNVYNSNTKQTTTVFRYWYEIAYRHPMNLKLLAPDGSTILDITFEDMTNYTVFKTQVNNGHAPGIDKHALKISFQDKVVEDNLIYIQNYLNDNYGYTWLKHSATIYRIDSKKYNYDTYQNAYEEIVSGFNALASDYNKAAEKIKAAIAIWEEELKTYDPADSKGRISSDIAIATNFNLYEAYLWTNDFDKAEKHLSKIIGLKPSKKEEALVKQYREFLKMQRQRMEMIY